MNIFEQEVEQIREQSKIKESNFEEEIAILKEQVKDRECQTVTENIELIRLQQDKKTKAGQITTLKSQLQGLEENLNKLKVRNIMPYFHSKLCIIEISWCRLINNSKIYFSYFRQKNKIYVEKMET